MRNFRFVVLSTLSVVIALTISPLQAAYVINVTQSGSDVVASGSGSLNLTALMLTGVGPFQGEVVVTNAVVVEQLLGVGVFNPATTFFGLLTGPTSFATTTPESFFPSSSSGTLVVLDAQSSGQVAVGVIAGYVSGTAMSGTSTWNNTTIAGLGLTPGTYIYTWGTGGTADSLTLQIGPPPPPPTPIPSSIYLLTIGMAGILGWQMLLARRRQA